MGLNKNRMLIINYHNAILYCLIYLSIYLFFLLAITTWAIRMNYLVVATHFQIFIVKWDLLKRAHRLTRSTHRGTDSNHWRTDIGLRH